MYHQAQGREFLDQNEQPSFSQGISQHTCKLQLESCRIVNVMLFRIVSSDWLCRQLLVWLNSNSNKSMTRQPRFDSWHRQWLSSISHWLWGSPNLLFKVNWRLFPTGKVAEHEAHHLPLSNVKADFMVWCLIKHRNESPSSQRIVCNNMPIRSLLLSSTSPQTSHSVILLCHQTQPLLFDTISTNLKRPHLWTWGSS